MNLTKQFRVLDISGTSVSYTNITMDCEDGFSVTLTSLGASVRRIICPSRNGDLQNIALSFASDEAYLGNELYAGATLAPTACRISNGLLPLPAGTVSLSKNANGIHHLHGGFHSASFQNWELVCVKELPEAISVTFAITLPDGLDGYPGNRRFTAEYTLTKEHVLTLHYEAVSDKDTYFNLSNHTYFNLTGDFSRACPDHVLQIDANRYITTTEGSIPDQICPVFGTPFDFTWPCSLKHQISRFLSDQQLSDNLGYNHCFVLNPGKAGTATDAAAKTAAKTAASAALPTAEDSDPVAGPEFHRDAVICAHPDSPVRIYASSDADCVHFYSGGYIPEGLSLAEHQRSTATCALAFEFQDYADAPGGHGFPYRTSAAGEKWQRTIQYRFEWEEAK